VDDLARKRQLHKARRKRWRRRQRQGVYVVDVPISDRVLVFLLETGQLSDAELAADDRSADGAIARTIARLAEAAVTAWEAREGRISIEENGPPLPPLARLSQTEQRRRIMGGARCCRQRQGWEKTLWTADDNGSTADGDKVLTFWLDAVE
jgi:hypothetical protein